MDTDSTVSVALVATDESIALYTSRELSALVAELDALEGHPEHETPAEHPSAVDHAPPARPRAAKGNRARSSRGAAQSEATEASTTERDVDPSEHVRTVSSSTELEELAAATWRSTRAALDAAMAAYYDAQQTRPVNEWREHERRWSETHAAWQLARTFVSIDVDRRLTREWQNERDAQSRVSAREILQPIPSAITDESLERYRQQCDAKRPDRARRRRKAVAPARPWSQAALLDTGTPRVSRADIATWDRALEGAPYEVIAAWTAVCEWVLAHPRNQGGEQ